jgi:phosphopantothenoylcysteine decarboxylase/phosphopantothenate--cysteine ligase
MALLSGKKILVGVTGSIALYKTLELIRLYVKAGAEVRVVMSDAAKRFINPLTFEAITRNQVLDDTTESWASANNHIDIGKWAELYVIAPVTANTINKLSNGIADNLITQTALAYGGQILLAPAANTNMYKNNTTQTSLKMLKLLNFEEIVPQKKLLACGDEGEGAMAEPIDIFHKSVQILLRDPYWTNRRVVVTGGGTKEKIDDVRYISNFSSGKMAAALSTALYYRGADVCLLETQPIADLPSELYVIDVDDSKELKEYLVDAIRVAKKGVMTKVTLMDDSVPELIRKKPYLFMAAAVSDYVPKFPQSGKLKKEMLGDTWSLELKKNEDILASINKEGIYAVGFKAESDPETALTNAKRMLTQKELDAVCLNNVSENPFGSDENQITLITRDREIELKKADKLTLSLELLEKFKALGWE